MLMGLDSSWAFGIKSSWAFLVHFLYLAGGKKDLKDLEMTPWEQDGLGAGQRQSSSREHTSYRDPSSVVLLWLTQTEKHSAISGCSEAALILYLRAASCPRIQKWIAVILSCYLTFWFKESNWELGSQEPKVTLLFWPEARGGFPHTFKLFNNSLPRLLSETLLPDPWEEPLLSLALVSLTCHTLLPSLQLISLKL